MTFARRAGTAAVAAALGIALAGCGPGTSGGAPEVGDASSTTEALSTSRTPVASPGMTLDQYILGNDITSSGVIEGEPGAPTITLPIPPGWEGARSRAPRGAYDAMVYTARPPSPTPPMIVAFLAKLSGDVNPALVREYAANEARVLPGFRGAVDGEAGTLAGYDATRISGSYTKGGADLLIEQRIVVIPVNDGVFVLKITAEGAEDVAMPLRDAMAAIDEKTTITL